MESSILLGLIMFAIGMFLVFIIVWLTRDKEEKKENNTSPTIELTPKIDILKEDGEFKTLLKGFNKQEQLLLPIGITEENNIKTININEMSNLLVLGTTGGGKSVLLNELLSTVGMYYTKEEVRIVAIDTSLVELSSFNNLPHYIKKSISLPQEINEELVELQKLLSSKKDNIPLLVFIDDVYDIYTYDKSNQKIILDLLRNGKEKNIHLILTTDTPTKELLTKELKDNIQGTLYLTMSPGEDEDLDLENSLTTEDWEYLTKIGNLIYEENNHKERIKVPEVLDEEIKAINNFYL